MTANVQVGTVIIQEGVILPQALAWESDPYSRNWRVVKTRGDSLDAQTRAAGWHFFFYAGKVDAFSLGSGEASLRAAVGRILAKVRVQNFNCVEVTAIVRKRFLGLPYVAVCAHPRHIQRSGVLQSSAVRRQSQHQADWASDDTVRWHGPGLIHQPLRKEAQES